MVRAQQLPDAPGFFAHFGLFALVAGGGTADVRVVLTPLSDQGERIAAAVTAGLRAGGTAEIVIDRERQAGRGYYRHLCFKVMVHAGGEPAEIGDGGFTDWTARLTANAKERLLICGMGTDRLATLSAGTA